MVEYIEIPENKYDTISNGVNRLYCWLHVLKSYTEEKGWIDQHIGNIDTVLDKILEEIDSVSKCI